VHGWLRHIWEENFHFILNYQDRIMLQKGLQCTLQYLQTKDIYTKLSSMKQFSLSCQHIIAVDIATQAEWKAQCCQVLPLLTLQDEFAVLLYFWMCMFHTAWWQHKTEIKPLTYILRNTDKLIKTHSSTIKWSRLSISKNASENHMHMHSSFWANTFTIFYKQF